MNIVRADVTHVVLPMKFTFTTGFGSIPERETLIVRLETADGVVGFGESAALPSPVYLPETITTCSHIIGDFLIPRLLNREVSIPEYLEDIAWIRGNNIAKHGVESALWDIVSQQEQRPLSSMLGGKRDVIAVGESIGMTATVDDLLRVVRKRVSEGFPRIKVKIKPGWDFVPLRAIRGEFPDIQLTVDANSSYTLSQLSAFQALDELNLAMIEQPLAFDDIVDHAKVQKVLKTPICLDESILSAEDARKAFEIGACRIINVKPGRVGGLTEVMKINDVAKQHGGGLWCGGMIETGIGTAINVIAASLSEFRFPADITTSSTFFAEDIIASRDLVYEGHAIVPVTPGIGVQVLEERIQTYRKAEFHSGV